MNNLIKPQGCTNLKLRQLTRMVTRHYDGYIAKTGLKNTQFALLSYVVRLGPIQPVDLAGFMRMEASTLTRNLQPLAAQGLLRSEEHTSELQPIMRIAYAVFCLKKKQKSQH